DEVDEARHLGHPRERRARARQGGAPAATALEEEPVGALERRDRLAAEAAPAEPHQVEAAQAGPVARHHAEGRHVHRHHRPGGAPTLANWKMRQPAPIVVRPVTTACGPIHESRPTQTCGPTTAYASTTTPVSSSAPGATTAVGWTRAPAGGAAANSTPATRADP